VKPAAPMPPRPAAAPQPMSPRPMGQPVGGMGGGMAPRPANPMGGGMSGSPSPRPGMPGGMPGASSSPQPYRPSWARDDEKDEL
jgi:hypothetical protein